MIKYVVKRTNSHGTSAYGKYYAHPVVEETIDLAGLARHMEDHNTGFSEAMCVGVMKAMVKCIKEQLLAGKNVKIDDLAIFSVGIRNKEGAATPEDFSASANIAGVKLRARATGTLSNANLNLAASLKKSNPTPPNTPSNTGTNTGTNNGTNTGSDNSQTQQPGNQNGSQTEQTQHTLTLNVSPANSGTVTGGGSYSPNAEAQLTAQPASGYRFVQWSDGNTNASRTYTVTEDKTLTATFAANSVPSGGTEEG